MICIPFLRAICSGRFSTSSGWCVREVIPRDRKPRASCINSSKCEDVCLRTAEANILRKSYSLRHEKMSRCTIRISSDCTSFATRFTNDVFPIRRGANRMVFTPYLKLLESTVISSLLPTKFSSSTATPNTNGFFIIFSFNGIWVQRYIKITNHTSLCDTSLCDINLFYVLLTCRMPYVTPYAVVCIITWSTFRVNNDKLSQRGLQITLEE